LKTFTIFLLSTLSTGCAFAQANVPLGAAGNFAILAFSTVTNTGPTMITGNIGVSTGTSITGFPPGVISGSTHLNDGLAQQAQTALTAAYNNAMTQPVTQNLTGHNLGGLTLGPGVYKFDSSAMLTGTLTLSGSGYYIFQIGSTLTVANGSAVLAQNGADSANIFWQVGASATLGTGISFVGNILALTSITVDTGDTLAGRLLASGGAVTLDDDNLTYPPATTTGGFGGPPATPIPASWILVLIGLACAMLYQTRGRWLQLWKNG